MMTITEEHPNADDWRNRAERAEHECAEIEARVTGEIVAWLREALEPSGETKAAYIGEFSFDAMVPDIDDENDELVPMKVDVPWTTIKEIMAAIVKRALENPDG